MRGPAWLVLPTFNEAENLERIVTAARGVLTAAAAVLAMIPLSRSWSTPSSTAAWHPPSEMIPTFAPFCFWICGAGSDFAPPPGGASFTLLPFGTSLRR